MSGAELRTSGVRNQLAVVDQVRWSLTSQRLVDDSLPQEPSKTEIQAQNLLIFT